MTNTKVVATQKGPYLHKGSYHQKSACNNGHKLAYTHTQPDKTSLCAADTKLLAKAQTGLLQVCILCCFVKEICFVCANDRVSDPDQDVLQKHTCRVSLGMAACGGLTV